MSAIPLQHVKIWGDKDPKDNKPLIKIDSPSSQLLVLKSSSQTDYMMWYNSIYFAALHAHAKRKMEEFDKALIRLEQENSRTDKKDVASFFYGAEGMLKVDESKELLFGKLADYKEECKYLGQLYDLIGEYKGYCECGQTVGAIKRLSKIHQMITDFKLGDDEDPNSDSAAEFSPAAAEEEAKEKPQLTRISMMEDMQKTYMEMDFKATIKEIVTESIIERITLALKDSEASSASASKPPPMDLFKELEAALIAKFKTYYLEMYASDEAMRDSLQLLTIPVERFKKMLHWTPPSFFDTFPSPVKDRSLDGKLQPRMARSNSLQIENREDLARTSLARRISMRLPDMAVSPNKQELKIDNRILM